jgi:anaerobic glycerol-3-phosphate dehydrogenase
MKPLAKSPGIAGAFLLFQYLKTLEHCEILQHRNDADDHNDGSRDLLCAPIDGQHIDEIKNENNDKKRNQNADQYRHDHPS